MSLVVPTTVVGNIVSDPEHRFTPSGKPVGAFRIAENNKQFNKTTSQWETANTTFYQVNAWGDQAENICASLRKGMEVVVVGKFQAREYETNEGEKRTALEIAVNFGSGVVAPVVGAFQAVEVTRKQRDGNSGGQSKGNGSWPTQPAQTGGDDWASAPAANNEPPF